MAGAGVARRGGRFFRWLGRVLLALGRFLRRPLLRVVRLIGANSDVALGLLTAVMFAIAWPTIPLTHSVSATLWPVLALAQVLPLVLLRRAPFSGWLVAVGASLVWWQAVPALDVAPMPWPVVQFLVLLATIVAVGMWGRWEESLIVLVGSGVLLGLAMPDGLKGWGLGQAVFLGVAWLIRWLVISRRQIAEQQEEVENERARRAVVEERSRIARELHDVVAHHMSMIVVQSQSAPVRLGLSDPGVVEEFSAIEASARQALTEVRSVLGVLRDEKGPVEIAPQPDLAQLPSLVKASKAAGMPLTSRLRVDASKVPPGTGLVLYRVAQESLANAARHAPGAAVELTLEEESGWARLMVRNSAPPTGETREVTANEGGGNGIPGMSERVRAVGGELHAEAVGDGWVVVATVPLTGRPQVAGLG